MRLGKLALFLLCPLVAHATACPTGYGYAKEFIVWHQNVNSTLTSFPVLLSFNGSTQSIDGISTPTSHVLPDLKTSGSGGKILSSGNDIVFCDAYSGGNLLNFDRAQWISTTGKAEFWVGRTLSSTTDTAIWMFYGKASDTDHSAAAATWSAANYVFVSHFGDGSTLSVTDSTGNTTPTNHSATGVTGQITGGVGLNGTSQYVAIGSPLNQTSITMEGWIKPTGVTGVQTIFDNTNSITAVGIFLATNGASAFFTTCNAGCGSFTTHQTTNGTVAAGVWSYIVGTMTGSASANMVLYVNGVVPGLQANNCCAVLTTSANNMTIGTGSAASGFWFGGTEDELRVASVIQTADWVAANYFMQVNPVAFTLMVDAIAPTGMTSGAYCVPLTVAHGQVPNTDQANFPLLVRGTYPWMADIANGGFARTGNSGKDIRFYANSGCTTGLNFQRIFWTNTTGDSSWRVRIPTLSHTTDTLVYVKIGSSADTSDLSTTWMGSYNYVGVYNGGSPGSLDLSDSGSANLAMGCGGSSTVAPGPSPVGGAFFFPTGSTDNQTCGWAPTVVGDSIGAHGYPTGSAAGHIRMWAKTVKGTISQGSGAGNDVNLGGYGKANGSGQRGIQVYQLAPQYTGMQSLTMSGSGPGIVTSTSGATPTFTMDNGWHAYDFDQPTNGAAFSATTVYIDGVPITSPIYFGTGVTGANVLNTDNTVCCTNVAEVRIGRTAAHGVAFFTGFVTQFEVTSTSLSADNIAARYNNEVSPSTFYSFGAAAPFSATSNQPVISVVF